MSSKSEFLAPPIKNWRTSLERIEKFLSRDFYEKFNLTSQLQYDLHSFLTSIPHIKIKGKEEAFDGGLRGEKLLDAIRNGNQEWQFSAIDLTKTKLGPTWSSYWFKFDFSQINSCVLEKISKATDSHTVGLVWKCDCEALLYSSDGIPLQSFSEERTFYPLPVGFTSKHNNPVFIELACNGMFGAGEHCIQPPNERKEFHVSEAKVVLRNDVAYHLYHVIEMLHDVANSLGKDNISGHNALYAANHSINHLHINGFSQQSLTEALAIANSMFPPYTTPQKTLSRLNIDAFGHCHIDTAWLWPYEETKRKCARSWSNQLAFMSDNVNFKFTCSQAQQFKWVEQNYPKLFSNIQNFVGRGQFIPLGGTWVEMDGNLPSCESFCRQFLYGQKYFMEKFGFYSDIFWLPDTFGYSTCLPQVANLTGIKYFLTQKLSWNLVNTFPHNSFIWQGIDGSQLLTHFPPNDNYCAKLKPSELVFAETNFKDKGRSNEAMMLFGFGDGGGGPTEEMILRLNCLQTNSRLEIPSCTTTTPSDFFKRLEQDKSSLCKWVGELYFELHQGTFTTQSEIKRCNNKLELLLKTVEFAVAVLKIRTDSIKMDKTISNNSCDIDFGETKKRIDEAWELVLCNQFHDVLPGSCIEQVAKDAIQYYTKAENILKSLDFECGNVQNSNEYITFKVDLSKWSLISQNKYSSTKNSASPGPSLSLENENMIATFNKRGQIVSLIVKKQNNSTTWEGRELICEGSPANVFKLYSDMPLFWDAWDIMDYYAETGVVIEADSHSVCANSIEFNYQMSQQSKMTLNISLPCDSPYLVFDLKVEWRESHKLLKVEFPFNLNCHEAIFGSQIGFVHRTNSLNTSQDTAKYEVCGHKWALMQQYGLGCAILTPSKYGFRALESTLALSLLRSPKSPDLNADMGTHQIRYGVLPYTGCFQSSMVQKHAELFNYSSFEPFEVSLPKCVMSVDDGGVGLIRVSTDAITIESFKMSEFHGLNAYTLRLSEQFGSSCNCFISFSELLPLKQYLLCDVLERPLHENTEFIEFDSNIELKFKPFKLITIILR